MPITSADIANRAGLLISDNQPLVVGAGNYPTETWVTTQPLGQAASLLYNSVVETVGRQFGWDFSRRTVTLAPGNTGTLVPAPWAFEYLYPANGIQIRQLMPATVTDPNNPLPVRWDVANDTIASVVHKVILTNLASAKAVYTNQVDENLWDAGFTESVVRLLASEFAIAVAGRPDTERIGIETFGQFVGAAESRDS